MLLQLEERKLSVPVLHVCCFQRFPNSALLLVLHNQVGVDRFLGAGRISEEDALRTGCRWSDSTVDRCKGAARRRWFRSGGLAGLQQV